MLFTVQYQYTYLTLLLVGDFVAVADGLKFCLVFIQSKLLVYKLVNLSTWLYSISLSTFC